MAEPANNGNNLLRFDNAGGNTNVPINRPTPAPIPTNDTNINAVSTNAIEQTPPAQSIREVINSEGEVELYRVSDVKQDGFITLFGNYPQNSVNIPKFDLSSINVINDEDVTFKFILCLKDGEDSKPQLFATSDVYDELIINYNNNNPIPTNYLINQRKIVVVDIAPLKQKIEDLRLEELSLDINFTTESDKRYVEVVRNLFAISNYTSDSVTGLKANPTYKIIELLKYISWVVTKPNPNYNDRLLSANILGQWGKVETTQPSQSQPPTPINNEVNSNGNTPQPNPNLYPPIGRAGLFDEEEAYYNGTLYLWDDNVEQWFEDRGNDSDRVGGRS